MPATSAIQPMRAGRGRHAFAFVAASVFAVLVYLLARVDAGVGRPLGPDRVLATIDASAGDATMKAQRVLRDRPIEGRAYRVLAQVAATRGQDAQARALWQIAVARWPRDRIARAVLADQAFAEGEIDAGLVHLDALLRVDVASRADVIALLMPHLGAPVLRDAFAARLATDPPWRSALPAALVADSTPADAAEALLAELAKRTRLSEAEIRTRVTLLDRLGQPARARALWLATLPPADRGPASLVYDGGFERPHVIGNYGWQLSVPAGVSAGPDTGSPHAGAAALAFEFDGRAVQFAGLRQALALSPGTYRLQAATRSTVESSRPFAWQLTCAGGERLTELPLPPSREWQRVSAAFTVPPDCQAQALQLRHLSRSMVERRLSGTLWIDDLGIFPGR